MPPEDADAGATAFLELAILSALSWVALRLITQNVHDPVFLKLNSAGRYWLAGVGSKAQKFYDESVVTKKSLSLFSNFRS
jgi:hypothetical protein